MPSKKILILSVAISLFAHALLISATGLFDLRPGKPKLDSTITVNLPEEQQVRAEFTNSDPDAKEPVSSSVEKTGSNISEQATMALDSKDQRFAPYLKRIKQKIENIWAYPPEAFAKKKEGVSSVAFSLDSRGQLLASKIVKSSGHVALDQGTINVIKAAAPYAPFPREIKLSRLHIQATFRYRFLK